MATRMQLLRIHHETCVQARAAVHAGDIARAFTFWAVAWGNAPTEQALKVVGMERAALKKQKCVCGCTFSMHNFDAVGSACVTPECKCTEAKLPAAVRS